MSVRALSLSLFLDISKHLRTRNAVSQSVCQAVTAEVTKEVLADIQDCKWYRRLNEWHVY